MEKDEILNKIKLKTKLNNFYQLLKNKDYELIYQYFGKDAYNFFAPYDYKKQDLRKLMEEKRYGLIYSKYGKFDLFFIKYLRRYKKEDINKLLKEGKYQDIYNKYGEKEYNKYVVKAYETDVLNETNDLTKMKLYKTNYKLKSGFDKILKKTKNILPLVSSFMLVLGTFSFVVQKITNYNEFKFKDELAEYNLNNDNYAKKVNSLNLNDLQIIMKVMDDIWTNMDGYGEPNKDKIGLWRLDMNEKEAVGVCRNIADDFTAKINAINPEYNARNLMVYIDEKYYDDNSYSNIQRNYAESYKQNDNNQNSKIENILSENLTNVIGNHMVTVLDIPGKNITLVVDTTNASIGVYKNGTIKILSNDKGKGVKYKPCGQFLFQLNTMLDLSKQNWNSLSDNHTKDFYEKNYGIDAQNEALDYVRKIKK